MLSEKIYIWSSSMKGLMVTLLVLSCAGMVHAQQEYNDSGFRPRNGTGGALADRDNSDLPVVPIEPSNRSIGSQFSTTSDPNPRTGGQFESAQVRGGLGRSTSMVDSPVVRKTFPERDSGLMNRPSTTTVNPADDNDKVIYLGLPNTELTGLLADGSVEAPIANPFVDRITISDQNRPSSNPVRRVQPELRGDKLVFEFSQDMLSRLGDYSYEFEVPTALKGRYKSAVIEYPPALQRNARATTPRTGTGVQADDNRWRLAGDRTTRQPVTDLYEQQRLAQIERDRQNALARQGELERQRWAQEQFEKEKAARDKLDLADQNRKLQEQIDRMLYEKQRDAALVNQRTTWPLPDSRFANRQFDPTYQPTGPPLSPPANNDSLAVSMIQQTQMRLAQLESENNQLRNEVKTVKNESDSLRRRFDIDNSYRRDLTNHRRDVTPVDNTIDTAPTIPNRRPVISTGGFDLNDRAKGQQASTSLDQPLGTEKDRGPFDLLMFMMLLGSVALNVYLWAVSRGFYMRYQELADELRETFAVSA